LDHLATYLPKSIDLIPQRYQLATIQNLKKYLLPMNSEDQTRMLEQDFQKYVGSEIYESLVQEFEKSIIT
jgi:hypothetical protein